MPALYTHYKLGNDVLKKLNKDQQLIINSNIKYYNMYNQGFDNLYYHFKWKYYRKFGVNAHKHNLDLFFQNVFTYIIDNNLKDNSEITNLIYGFINHLTLDIIIHPYINYQVKHLNIPHTKIEFMLDYYNYQRENNTKWKNKIYKELIPKVKFSAHTINFLNHIFLNTYNINNIGKVFNKSHNNGYYIYRFFITDIHGIKTIFYRIIDFIFPFFDIKLHQNTFNKKIDLNILNEEKNKWPHPHNKKEIYDYSFQELYDLSLGIATKLNNLAYQVLNDNASIEELITLINKINLKNISEFLD